MRRPEVAQSARINSACINKNRVKYNPFITCIGSSASQGKIIPLIKNPIIDRRLDDKLKEIEEKECQDEIIRLRQNDYLRFVSKKQGEMQMYQGKLRELFSEERKIDKRFYKDFYSKEKEYYKPLAVWSKQFAKADEAEEYDHPILKEIVRQESMKRIKVRKQNVKQKRKKELKAEETLERQQKKERMEKYLNGEQRYFDNLTSIGDKGAQNFKEKIKLRSEYYFENLMEPVQGQFVGYKDLRMVSEEGDYKMPEIELCFENVGVKQFDNPVDFGLGEKRRTLKMKGRDEEDEIEIFWRMIRQNDKDGIKTAVLLEPNILKLRDERGMSALHLAILRGYRGLAKFLMRKGMDYNEADSRGMSPLQLAKRLNNQDVLNYIRQMENNYNPYIQKQQQQQQQQQQSDDFNDQQEQ